MSLTSEDLIKIKLLFDPEFERINTKLEKLDMLEEIVSSHSDMLVDIIDRLNRSELSFIVAKVDDNTRRIENLEKKLS